MLFHITIHQCQYLISKCLRLISKNAQNTVALRIHSYTSNLTLILDIAILISKTNITIL